MEFQLIDLFCVTHRFSEVDLLIVSAYKVASHHCLRLAYNLKHASVERGLDNAVIELEDEHVLLHAAQSLRNQLRVLYFVVVEASIV